MRACERPGAPEGALAPRRALALGDALLAAAVVAPAVVGYWRGTWCLMDVGVGWAPSMAVGLLGHLLFTLGQRWLVGARAALAGAPADGQRSAAARLTARCRRAAAFVVSRVYTAAFAFCCVNAWRGSWKLLDQYLGLELRPLWATSAFGVAALVAMRTLRNISAPPFAIATDCVAGYFDVPTMFRVPSTRHAYLYVLDCLFSVLVVGTLVVFVWRGAWTLLDLYLYPDHPAESAWASLALGYAVVAVTFALQPLLKGVCARLRGLWRLLVADLYLFFSFLGTVNIWRGFWNLLNLYFLMETPLLSYWVTHVGCLLLLMLLNCSNSILVRGVYIDAEEEGGKCVVFPTHYLRLFIKERQQNERQDLQQLERMLPAGDGRTPSIVPALSPAAPAPAAPPPAATAPAAPPPPPEQLESLLAPPRLLPANHLPLSALLNAPKSAL